MKVLLRWMGSLPTKCDMCSTEITSAFVDGKMSMGPWANMCLKCHKAHGVGTGLGKGQQYDKQDNGEWLKTKG